MSDIRTRLNVLTASNTYTPKYPVSKSEIINRDTSSISNIIGTNLQDCLQSTANRYIPQKGKTWLKDNLPSASGGTAVCSDGNFVFIKQGNQCKMSFNGGKTFSEDITLPTVLANVSVMNCKRVKVSSAVYSYHVIGVTNNTMYVVRIDGDTPPEEISAVTKTVTLSSFTSPHSVFFTDGVWYVYNATKVAAVTDIEGSSPTVVITTPSSHSHMTKGIYAPEMGVYVTIDNGNVVLSDEKIGGGE